MNMPLVGEEHSLLEPGDPDTQKQLEALASKKSPEKAPEVLGLHLRLRPGEARPSKLTLVHRSGLASLGETPRASCAAKISESDAGADVCRLHHRSGGSVPSRPVYLLLLG